MRRPAKWWACIVLLFSYTEHYCRIVEWVRWAETPSHHLTQPLLEARPPRAQDCVPSRVGYPQGWKRDSASLGNPCQRFTNLVGKVVFLRLDGIWDFSFVPVASCPAGRLCWDEPGSRVSVPSLRASLPVDVTPPPRAVSSPGWAFPALSASHYRRDAPV